MPDDISPNQPVATQPVVAPADRPTADDPTVSDEEIEAALDINELRKRMGLPDKAADKADAKAEANSAEPDDDAEETEAEADATDADDSQQATQQAPAPQPSPTVAPEEVKQFSQADVNRFMANERRISKEAQAAVKELEAITGLPIDKLRESYRVQQAQKLADDYGMTEAEAKAIVADREKARQLEARMAEIEAEQATIKRQQAYEQQKAQYASNPHVQRYAAEIDQFAQQFASWNYDVAVRAVLGQKALDGQLQQEVAKVTRQQTIANVSKGSVRVESARSAAAPAVDASSLTPEQREFVAGMRRFVPGLTAKGVAKRAQDMKRQGRR